MKKLCIRCNLKKDIKKFYRDNYRKDKLSCYCKSCQDKNLIRLGIRSKEYRKAEYKRNKETYRENSYKRKFNISIEDYNYLFNKQNGLCSICKGKFVGRKDARHFAIDHNHKTKKIRGLLCSNCNKLLGMCKDNIEILKLAIKYLRRYERN